MSENTHNTQDFRIFSLSIEFLTTLYGLFMVIWGIAISLFQEVFYNFYDTCLYGRSTCVHWLHINDKTEIEESFDAHSSSYWHNCFFGWSGLFRGMFTNYYAGLSKLMLMVTGFVYVYFCVQSFIFVRRQKN